MKTCFVFCLHCWVARGNGRQLHNWEIIWLPHSLWLGLLGELLSVRVKWLVTFGSRIILNEVFFLIWYIYFLMFFLGSIWDVCNIFLHVHAYLRECMCMAGCDVQHVCAGACTPKSTQAKGGRWVSFSVTLSHHFVAQSLLNLDLAFWGRMAVSNPHWSSYSCSL